MSLQSHVPQSQAVVIDGWQLEQVQHASQDRSRLLRKIVCLNGIAA